MPRQKKQPPKAAEKPPAHWNLTEDQVRIFNQSIECPYCQSNVTRGKWNCEGDSIYEKATCDNVDCEGSVERIWHFAGMFPDSRAEEADAVYIEDEVYITTTPVTEMERTLLLLGLLKCGSEMNKYANITALTELLDKVRALEVWA